YRYLGVCPLGRVVQTACVIAVMCFGMDSAEAQTNSEAPAATPQLRTNPAFARVIEDPTLTRVLLIAASISFCYSLPIVELLKGEANVHRIPTNGGPSTRGLASIDAWLGEGKWDVIHFNWGLHDLKYVDEKGALMDPPQGTQQVP